MVCHAGHLHSGAQMGYSCLQSVGYHGLALFDEGIALPLVIPGQAYALGTLGCDGFPLHAYQLGVGGEVWQCGTLEVCNRLEVVLLHKFLRHPRPFCHYGTQSFEVTQIYESLRCFQYPPAATEDHLTTTQIEGDAEDCDQTCQVCINAAELLMSHFGGCTWSIENL